MVVCVLSALSMCAYAPMLFVPESTDPSPIPNRVQECAARNSAIDAVVADRAVALSKLKETLSAKCDGIQASSIASLNAATASSRESLASAVANAMSSRKEMADTLRGAIQDAVSSVEASSAHELSKAVATLDASLSRVAADGSIAVEGAMSTLREERDSLLTVAKEVTESAIEASSALSVSNARRIALAASEEYVF